MGKLAMITSMPVAHWLLPILLRKIQFYLMVLRDNLCIVTPLELCLYNILSTYAFVHLSCYVSNEYQSSICFTRMASI